MKISFFLAWYDFWIGWYYDQKKQCLYISPLPMCVVVVRFKDVSDG